MESWDRLKAILKCTYNRCCDCSSVVAVATPSL